MKVPALVLVCAISLALGVKSELSDGGDSNNNGTCNCNPEEAPAICAEEGSDGTLVAHEKCNWFYNCFNGNPVAMKCNVNLVYNPYKEYCDWNDNVECGDRIIPDPDEDDNNGGNGDNGGGDGGDGDGDIEDGDGSNNATCNCNPEEAPAICAQEGSDGTLIAHEKCTWFYNCFNGRPVAMRCNNNLLYNPYKQYCDWPENVECGDRVIPDPDEDENDGGNGDNGDGDGDVEDGDGSNNATCNCNPEEAPAICAQEGSDGTLIAHERCTWFYNCFNGRPVGMRCNNNLLYNPYKQYCDWPENVDCGDRVIPDPDEDDNDGGNGDGGDGDGDIEDGDGSNNATCNCNPEEAPAICAQLESDGTLIAHEICNRFYKCFNGQPIAMRCNENLLYNPYKQYCDWPENVECGDRVIPDPDEDDSDGGNGEGGDGDGDIEDGDGSNNATCNCNPEEAPAICAQEGSDGTLIAHEKCTWYYNCFNGRPVAMRCNNNLLYNPYKQYCDWPENVDCGDRVIPDPDEDDNDGGNGDGGDGDGDIEDGDGSNNATCNCNPEEAPAICAQVESDGTLIAHEICNRFYKCFNGQPIAMRCNENLLYNPYKQYCDWPENVECGDRVIPDPDEDDNDGGEGDGGDGDGDIEDGDGSNNATCNCSPEEAPAICAEEKSDGTLIAHEICNRYYKCFNGQPVAMRCNNNLLYNPYKLYCDWPENVECGDRLIPDPDEDDNDGGNGDGGDGGNGDGGDGDGDVEDGDGSNNATCNCNPEEAPAICAQVGSDGTLIAHENCNWFYNCLNGRPFEMRCYGNLYFNPYKLICDWPENVECGGRIIPGSDEDEHN